MPNKEYICYTTSDAKNLINIDRYFENIALKLGAEQFHIPALISKDVLKKCGYFSSFPHHLTMASYYDPNSYDEIANIGEPNSNNIKNSLFYFTPSACLHLYPMLENEKIEKKIITTRARVYRYENNNFNGSTRLWDFTVREIVFIGSPEFVKNKIEQIKQLALEYSASIGLNAYIESATDNFYPSKKNILKEKLQKSNSLKEELICLINNSKVALASFNYHGFHFSKPFNFDNANHIVSGCIGFGLERWISAINQLNNKYKEF